MRPIAPRPPPQLRRGWTLDGCWFAVAVSLRQLAHYRWCARRTSDAEVWPSYAALRFLYGLTGLAWRVIANHLRSNASLQTENLVLRQQLAIYRRQTPRLALNTRAHSSFGITASLS